MLYNYSAMKKPKVLQYQDMVLKALSGKIDDFYLAGGTALSLFYFQHRLSVDLDFFTDHFSHKRVNEIVSYLKEKLGKKVEAVAQSTAKDKAKINVYNVYFTKKDTLKIDFVEDIFGLIKKTKYLEGIRILSLEDIYLRKLYALVGVIPAHDMAGRKKFEGGRVEAKDFYDLYFLSHTFMPLSEFVDKFTDIALKEALINWFRTYDRMKIMDGILDLDTNKKASYKNMEMHFKKEIDRIIKGEIEGI